MRVQRKTPLRATFTRLGGRKLDTSNLPSSMKAVEDAVCMYLGIDDGSPLWLPTFAQEPGGQVGVKFCLVTESDAPCKRF